MRFSAIICLLMLMSIPGYSQQQSCDCPNSIIKMVNDEFVCDNPPPACTDPQFFPMVMNYSVDIRGCKTYGFEITPQANYSSSVYDGHFTDNYTIPENLNLIKSHFQEIINMGFNTVRLNGFTLKYETTLEDCNNNKTFNVPHLENFRLDVVGDPNEPGFTDFLSYEDYFTLMDTVMYQANQVDLKVIIMLGNTGPERPEVRDMFTDYLEAFGNHFNASYRYRHNLIAAYVYGEPFWSGDETIYSKTEVCEITSEWYDALKSGSPDLIVGYGLDSYRDVFEWDPGVVKSDYIGYHGYLHYTGNPTLDLARYNRYWSTYKWNAETTIGPWIIGETGFAGSDNGLDVGAYGGIADQKTFITDVMDRVQECGGVGFSYWVLFNRYISIPGSPGDFDHGNAENFFGVKWIDSDNLDVIVDKWSPIDQFSMHMDDGPIPSGIGPGCNVDGIPSNYYNSSGYSSYKIFGKIVDENNVPIVNAVIQSYNPDPAFTNEDDSRRTFTDGNGNFELYINSFVNAQFVRISAVQREVLVVSTPTSISPINIGTQTLHRYDDVLYLNDSYIDQNFSGLAANDITFDNVIIDESNHYYEAGNSIHLKNEVCITGDNVNEEVRMRIIPNGCSTYDIKSLGQSGGDGKPAPNVLSESTDLKTKEFDIIKANIYPNPSSGHFTVELSRVPERPVQIEIISMLGHTVLVTRSVKRLSELDFETAAPGIYFVKVSDGEKQIVKKIVKE